MTPRAPEALPWRALVAVLALAALAYANSFAGVPQYDDYNVIIDDPAVRSLAAWRAAMPGIRPLLKLSYAFNNSWGGLAGFHSLNLLLHLFNAALVLLLLRRLLPDVPAAALAGALLFALRHHLQRPRTAHAKHGHGGRVCGRRALQSLEPAQQPAPHHRRARTANL